MDELESRLWQVIDGKQDKMHDVHQLQITKGAYHKMMTYAKVVGKMAGTGMECYGYLIAPKDSLDDVITDVFFAYDQDARSAYAEVNPEGVLASGKEIEATGYRILGWWHSHGTMSTFHSGTDEGNHLTILKGIPSHTKYRNAESRCYIDEENKRLVLETAEIDGIDVEKMKEAIKGTTAIKKVERDPFAYSIVVNIYGDHFIRRKSMTFNELKGKIGEDVVNQSTEPKLELVDRENDITFTISDIENDAQEKIRMTHYAHTTKCTETPGWGFKGTYWNLCKRFVSKAVEYAETGGSDFALMAEFMTRSDGQKLEALINGAPKDMTPVPVAELKKNKKEIIDGMKKYFERKNPKIKESRNKNMDYADFCTILELQFIADFVQANCRKNEVCMPIQHHKERAKNLADSHALAVDATKALAKYAMEEVTDYSKRKEFRHCKRAAGILENLCKDTYVTFRTAAKNEAERPKDSPERIFLWADRLKAVNQITRYIFGRMDNDKTEDADKDMIDFLQDFADRYAKGEDCDGIIEERILKRWPELPKKSVTAVQDIPKRVIEKKKWWKAWQN